MTDKALSSQLTCKKNRTEFSYFFSTMFNVSKNNVKMCSKKRRFQKKTGKQKKNNASQKNNENSHECLSDGEENSKIPQASECCKINYECREATHAIIDTLSLNIHFLLHKDDRMYYCIICNNKICINNNNKLSEEFVNHIKYSNTHKKLLSQLVDDDINYMKDGKPFSILGLAQEYMILDKNKNVLCLLCEGLLCENLSKINNDDQAIAEHIISSNHQNLKISWKEYPSINKDVQTIHKSFPNKKYSVRNYSCEFCSYKSPVETNFIKHLGVLYHRKRLAELYKAHATTCNLQFNFYYCDECQHLWFGNSQAIKFHCETLEHINRTKYGNVLNKVPNTISNILLNAEQEAEVLLEQSNNECYSKKINNMLLHLKAQLQCIFPNLIAYPFGSRISYLALPGSDIDIFVDCDYMYEGGKSHRDPRDLILIIEQFLFNNPQEWEVRNVVLSTKIPIVKAYNIPLGLMCDISVTSGLAVENTKLIRVLNEAFPCGRKIILYLRQWLRYCNLSDSITNYALTWCVFFYLQKLLVFPSISELIKLKKKSWKISGWEVGVSYKFPIGKSNFTFDELLMGFFMFYAEFNYDFVICPLLGKPLKKNEFDVKKFVSNCSEHFCITPLSIQDPFELSHNLTKRVSKTKFKTFREYCCSSAQIMKNKLIVEKKWPNPLLLSYLSTEV